MGEEFDRHKENILQTEGMNTQHSRWLTAPEPHALRRLHGKLWPFSEEKKKISEGVKSTLEVWKKKKK